MMLRSRQVTAWVVTCDRCTKPVTEELRHKTSALIALGSAIGEKRAYLTLPEGESDISKGLVSCPDCHGKPPTDATPAADSTE